jgi:hypothetical protein
MFRLIVATATVLAAPAVASAAPTVTTDQPCYVAEKQLMQFSGQGYTPGGDVNLFFSAGDKFGTYTAKADAAGAIQASVRAPGFDMFDQDPPSFDMFVTANDAAKLGPEGPIGPPEETFAAVQLKITDWTTTVAAFGKPVKRGQRVKLDTIGWVGAGEQLYVHYLRGGKAVRSEKVGALKGACGDLTKSFKAFNFKTAKPGNYAVRFSTEPKYSAKDRWSGFKVKLTA